MTLSYVLVCAPPDCGPARVFSDEVRALGASTAHVWTIDDAITIIVRSVPDLVAVYLDTDPLSKGYEFIRRVRFLLAVPILALADTDDGSVVARALAAGADDYLTGQPSAEGLATRLAALQPGSFAGDREGPIYRVRDLVVDCERCEVALNGRRVEVTPTEFRLLASLIRRAGRVLSARDLVKDAQGYQLAEPDARDLAKVHLARLRAKMRPFEQGQPYIVNVRGFGYMLERRTAPRPDDLLAARMEPVPEN